MPWCIHNPHPHLFFLCAVIFRCREAIQSLNLTSLGNCWSSAVSSGWELGLYCNLKWHDLIDWPVSLGTPDEHDHTLVWPFLGNIGPPLDQITSVTHTVWESRSLVDPRMEFSMVYLSFFLNYFRVLPLQWLAFRSIKAENGKKKKRFWSLIKGHPTEMGKWKVEVC